MGVFWSFTTNPDCTCLPLRRWRPKSVDDLDGPKEAQLRQPSGGSNAQNEMPSIFASFSLPGQHDTPSGQSSFFNAPFSQRPQEGPRVRNYRCTFTRMLDIFPFQARNVLVATALVCHLVHRHFLCRDSSLSLWALVKSAHHNRYGPSDFVAILSSALF